LRRRLSEPLCPLILQGAQVQLTEFFCTLGLFAQDVSDVMNNVAWRSAIIAGCSLGGTVAQALAIGQPGRAQGLVLMNTAARYGSDPLSFTVTGK
jgi:pimeloyl-ACP methyl ester carboxylesterase